MYLFVDETNLVIIVKNVHQNIADLSPEAIATGVGQVALNLPSLFNISFGEPDDDSCHIDIRERGDSRIAAIGLDGFGLGDSIPEAVGWLLFISETFDQVPDVIAQALESDD